MSVAGNAPYESSVVSGRNIVELTSSGNRWVSQMGGHSFGYTWLDDAKCKPRYFILLEQSKYFFRDILVISPFNRENDCSSFGRVRPFYNNQSSPLTNRAGVAVSHGPVCFPVF